MLVNSLRRENPDLARGARDPERGHGLPHADIAGAGAVHGERNCVRICFDSFSGMTTDFLNRRTIGIHMGCHVSSDVSGHHPMGGMLMTKYTPEYIEALERVCEAAEKVRGYAVIRPDVEIIKLGYP